MYILIMITKHNILINERKITVYNISKISSGYIWEMIYFSPKTGKLVVKVGNLKEILKNLKSAYKKLKTIEN